MQEKFSVGLELVVDKFNGKIEGVKKAIGSIGQVAKNGIVLDSSSIKSYTAEQDKLLYKINDIKATLKMATNDPKLFGTYEILEMRSELEKLESQFKKTTQTSSSFSKVGDKISKTLSKSIGNVKRFTLSLFGIQSAFRMLSRASSAYLAQDQETSNKIQAAWIGLGSIFAPLLETIANFVIKAVSYLNIFIKALTGVDYLARASARSLNKTNSSAKKLSKTLAGFDEITNLDSESNSGGIGSNWASFFDDVELNPEVVKKLQDLAKWLKKNEDLIKAVGKALAITFGAAAVGRILKGIGGLLGSAASGKGLLALSSILGGLATIGGIAISIYFVGKILQEAKELRKEMDLIRKSGQEGYNNWVKETKDIDKIYNSMQAHRTTTEKSLENTNNWLYKITGTSKIWSDIASGIVETSNSNLNRIKELYGVEIKSKEEKQKALETLKLQLDTLFKVRDQMRLQGEDTTKIDETMKRYSSTLDSIAEDLGVSANYTRQMNDWLSKSNTNAAKLLKTMTSIAGLGGGSSFGGGGFGGGGSGGGRIPAYDVGTNYIPQDTLAMVHKGEAIIPKKFNSATYFSGNSKQTNALLEQLIDRVENIEINPYTTIKDVGQASVGYINNQNRIMGRGVI